MRITIRLDRDVLEWFRAQAEAVEGGSYQRLINQALRDRMEQEREPLEETVRRALRKELALRFPKERRGRLPIERPRSRRKQLPFGR